MSYILDCEQQGTLQVKKLEKQTKQGITEHTLQIKNTGTQNAVIKAALPFELDIMKEHMQLQFFTSQWSKEFTPVKMAAKTITLEGREGRSSAGMHPMLFVTNQDESYELAVMVAHSGNWKIGVQNLLWGTRFFAGAYCEGEEIIIAPGEIYVTPKVLTIQPRSGELQEISASFQRWFLGNCAIQNESSAALPVEWNHWWTYEDYAINEEIFIKNTDAAKQAGCEAVLLDAGWFGEDGLWYDMRGDYARINTKRFPHGIRYLSDYAHERGLKFGLWCEIEALGVKAQLSREEPSFMAKRDGEPISYVCFGNPLARQWAFNMLDKLILDYNLDWIKLDFNLDPFSGCNRTDHGHNENDGLYQHYLGYFSVLDAIREKHPQVILENCSSGGLRIDFKTLHHTHATFVCDSDETDKRMSMCSALFTMLPPRHVLTWVWSYSRKDEHGRGPFPRFNPEDKAYKPHELIYHFRAGMLGWYGMSHPLCDYTPQTMQLFKEQTEIYKKIIRPYVQKSIVYNLGFTQFCGEKRAHIFQYCPDNEFDKNSLIMAFSHEEGELMLPKLYNIDENAGYKLLSHDTGEEKTFKGAELLCGIALGKAEKHQALLLEVIKL